MPKLTICICALVLVGCFSESDPNGDPTTSGTSGETTGGTSSDPVSDGGTEQETSTGGSTSAGESSGSATGSGSSPTSETDASTSTGSLSPVYGPCESADDCAPDAFVCLVDDFGHGLCTIPCLVHEDCPETTSGDAQPYCTSNHGDLCVLNCDYWDCPDGMECLDTQYDGNFAGNLCLWP